MWSGYPGRIGVLLALFGLGYGVVYVSVVADVIAGSRTPLLALAPVLVLLASTGYRHGPDGVSDNESDWIFVALTGAVAATGVWLLDSRYPALAGLWRLDLQSAVLWIVCASMILFGIRHTARTWPVWIFASACFTPVPYLLATAALGGSDTAAANVGVAFGATAVYLSAARAARHQRLAMAALCLALGMVAVPLLIPHTTLFVTVAVVAAAIPVLTVVTLRRWAHPSGLESGSPYPSRSWGSFAVLTMIAVGLSILSSSEPRPPAPTVVETDWAEHAELGQPTELPFITDFLGPDATLARFEVPAQDGSPAAAVDVITAGSLAPLRDVRNVVWYPSSSPLTYRPAASILGEAGVREVHSHADTATTDNAPHWYALTWDWQTAAGYQRVTVVVNQDPIGTTRTPPAPGPLSVNNTLIEPLLWHGRQQDHPAGEVPAPVIERAREIAARLLAAGDSPSA